MANCENLLNVVVPNTYVLPELPKVEANNIPWCHSLLQNVTFCRGIYVEVSCYIVNSDYKSWTIKLRPPAEGEVTNDTSYFGFVPPTQIVYSDVLRNYMDNIVPPHFAVGDIIIESRYYDGTTYSLWCVDLVEDPFHESTNFSNKQENTELVVRNVKPPPLILPKMTKYRVPPVANNINAIIENMIGQKRKRGGQIQ